MAYRVMGCRHQHIHSVSYIVPGMSFSALELVVAIEMVVLVSGFPPLEAW